MCQVLGVNEAGAGGGPVLEIVLHSNQTLKREDTQPPVVIDVMKETGRCSGEARRTHLGQAIAVSTNTCLLQAPSLMAKLGTGPRKVPRYTAELPTDPERPLGHADMRLLRLPRPVCSPTGRHRADEVSAVGKLKLQERPPGSVTWSKPKDRNHSQGGKKIRHHTTDQGVILL